MREMSGGKYCWKNIAYNITQDHLNPLKLKLERKTSSTSTIIIPLKKIIVQFRPYVITSGNDYLYLLQYRYY